MQMPCVFSCVDFSSHLRKSAFSLPLWKNFFSRLCKSGKLGWWCEEWKQSVSSVCYFTLLPLSKEFSVVWFSCDAKDDLEEWRFHCMGHELYCQVDIAMYLSGFQFCFNFKPKPEWSCVESAAFNFFFGLFRALNLSAELQPVSPWPTLRVVKKSTLLLTILSELVFALVEL